MLGLRLDPVNEKRKQLFDHIVLDVRVDFYHKILVYDHNGEILKSFALVQDQCLLRLILANKSSEVFYDMSRFLYLNFPCNRIGDIENHSSM